MAVLTDDGATQHTPPTNLFFFWHNRSKNSPSSKYTASGSVGVVITDVLRRVSTLYCQSFWQYDMWSVCRRKSFSFPRLVASGLFGIVLFALSIHDGEEGSSVHAVYSGSTFLLGFRVIVKRVQYVVYRRSVRYTCTTGYYPALRTNACSSDRDLESTKKEKLQRCTRVLRCSLSLAKRSCG